MAPAASIALWKSQAVGVSGVEGGRCGGCEAPPLTRPAGRPGCYWMGRRHSGFRSKTVAGRPPYIRRLSPRTRILSPHASREVSLPQSNFKRSPKGSAITRKQRSPRYPPSASPRHYPVRATLWRLRHRKPLPKRAPAARSRCLDNRLPKISVPQNEQAIRHHPS